MAAMREPPADVAPTDDPPARCRLSATVLQAGAYWLGLLLGPMVLALLLDADSAESGLRARVVAAVGAAATCAAALLTGSLRTRPAMKLLGAAWCCLAIAVIGGPGWLWRGSQVAVLASSWCIALAALLLIVAVGLSVAPELDAWALCVLINLAVLPGTALAALLALGLGSTAAVVSIESRLPGTVRITPIGRTTRGSNSSETRFVLPIVWEGFMWPCLQRSHLELDSGEVLALAYDRHDGCECTDVVVETPDGRSAMVRLADDPSAGAERVVLTSVRLAPPGPGVEDIMCAARSLQPITLAANVALAVHALTFAFLVLSCFAPKRTVVERRA